MDNSQLREMVMKLIYEREMGGCGGEETVRGLLELEPSKGEMNRAEQRVAAVFENLAEIDREIEGHLVGWTLERLSRVDISILRLAVYEIKFCPDIPVGASVNEAVELSKMYSQPDSGGFINGVLGSIGRSARQAE